MFCAWWIFCSRWTFVHHDGPLSIRVKSNSHISCARNSHIFHKEWLFDSLFFYLLVFHPSSSTFQCGEKLFQNMTFPIYANFHIEEKHIGKWIFRMPKSNDTDAKMCLKEKEFSKKKRIRNLFRRCSCSSSGSLFSWFWFKISSAVFRLKSLELFLV